jgi:aryl-alcohol dehydrogenase-like predicted oxidoreductase
VTQVTTTPMRPASAAHRIWPGLALGTAQFGMDYGLFNRGKVSDRECGLILERAWELGVDVLDTAAAYGRSEEVIGCVRPPGSNYRIVTKTVPLRTEQVSADDIKRVRDGVYKSQRLLGEGPIDALLVHNAADIIAPGGDRLVEMLETLKRDGVCRKIGVSVYDHASLFAVRRRMAIEVVQLPLNVFDQRFARDGAIADLAADGIEVHVRSVFLQGILLHTVDDLPPHLSAIGDHLRNFREAATAVGFSAGAAALRYVALVPGVARIVIGVNDIAELETDVSAFRTACQDSETMPLFDKFSVTDAKLVDPRLWAQ